MTLALHAWLLLSTDDASPLPLLVKPLLNIAVFGAYGLAVGDRAHWTKSLLAGAVRTALGFALGAVTFVVATMVPPLVILLLVALCRFGLWYSLARLFYPGGGGGKATLLGVVGVALNLAVDWLLLGGAVVTPA